VLAAQLSMAYALASNVEVIQADILAIDFDTLFAPRPGTVVWHPAYPRKSTSSRQLALLHHLGHSVASVCVRAVLDRVVIMVQREVADRLVAKPGGSEYGLLSATAQLYARSRSCSSSAHGVQPAPKVHSAVIRLTMEPRRQELGALRLNDRVFLSSPSRRSRKTLWNNLKARYSDAELKAALEEQDQSDQFVLRPFPSTKWLS